jgi:hypothetical protein
MEAQYFNGEIICYKTKFEPKFSKDTLVDKIYEIINEQTLVDNDGYLITKDYKEYFFDIVDMGKRLCYDLINNPTLKPSDILVEPWINRVRKVDAIQPGLKKFDIENPIYHDHVTINKKKGVFIPNYTFVYYIQMQNNLNGNDGHLLMKNKNGDRYSILPEETDFIIMEGNVPHSPIPAFNSTKDRLVLAGNVGIDVNKKEKTLL